MRRTCLVTGARGLVGQHLLPLLSADYDVLALSRDIEGAPSLPGVTWMARDLASAGFAHDLPQHVDAVVHLAQSRRYREVPDGAADVLAVNVAATEQLAGYAARSGATHFVLASTGSVYAPTTDVITEDSTVARTDSVGWYAGSKLAAEALVYGYRTKFVPVVLRPFFVYGAGQQRSMMVPRLADTIARGDTVTLNGPDGMQLAPTHASDAAMAFLRALRLEAPATINVCGPETLSFRALSNTLGALVGCAPQFAVSAATAADFRVNGARMRALLGAPVCTFAAGAPSVIAA